MPSQSKDAQPAAPAALLSELEGTLPTGRIEPFERHGLLSGLMPAWMRAALLTVGVAGCTGIAVLTGQSFGLALRDAVIMSLPIGIVVGFLMAAVLILLPEWRAAADRRWLVECLRNVARIDREQKFAALLSQGEDHELHELARAIHEAMLSAHKDRLEAAQLRRELEARVNRRTKAVVAELSKLTTTDELTGLLNRRGLESALSSLFEASATSGDELALLAVDMDFFKQLNDACGHDCGDRALRAASEVMRAQLREGDAAGRIGGDEFVVLLHGSGIAQARRVAERLVALFARSPHAMSVPTKWPTFSIGVACAGEHKAESPGHLRKMADQALYAAKRAGRSTCVVYSPRCAVEAKAA